MRLDPVLSWLSLKNNPFLVVPPISEPWIWTLPRRCLNLRSLRSDFPRFGKRTVCRHVTPLAHSNNVQQLLNLFKHSAWKRLTDNKRFRSYVSKGEEQRDGGKTFLRKSYLFCSENDLRAEVAKLG